MGRRKAEECDLLIYIYKQTISKIKGICDYAGAFYFFEIASQTGICRAVGFGK